MKNWDEEGGLKKWEWILERKELGEGKEEVEMYPSCRNVEVGMEVMDQF